ncbi:MAG: flagellin [Rhodothermales bacterium]
MAFGDLSRINSNILSMQSLHEFQKTSSEIGTRQLRLATGSRINSASDDPSGFAIASRLESRVRGQAQALANIADAQSMLSVAEGSLGTIQDILMTMKEKVMQGANDTLASSDRTIINSTLNSLSTEINSIVSASTYNGMTVFSTGALSFQVGEGTGDTFSVTVGGMSTGVLGVGSAAIDVASAASATASLTLIDSAINSISSTMAGIGNNQTALTFRQESLNNSMLNQESARSRIQDADFAKEQIEIVKLQIMQQTGIAAIQNSNMAPQMVLSLL